MLEIQKAIQNKSLNDVIEEFGLRIAYHPTLPLIILNYSQVDSRPKNHPIVKEARSLVLDLDGQLVSRSFPRFFNVGELPEEMESFNWNDFIVHEKCDGSLVSIFYYKNSWHVRTRGSWALDTMQYQNFTWEAAILEGLEIENKTKLDQYLDRHLTYVCEFCSPYNKVVRQHKFAHLYFLTAFEGEKIGRAHV